VSVPRHGPHALRHACATHLLAQGLSLTAIGDHLGHRDPDATRAFARLEVARMERGLPYLDVIYAGAPLIGLTEAERNLTLTRLETARLLTVNRAAGIVERIDPSYQLLRAAHRTLLGRIANSIDVRNDHFVRVDKRAGELVEQQSNLSGTTWTTTAFSLSGIGMIRRNSEYHHRNLLNANDLITNTAGSIQSKNE